MELTDFYFECSKVEKDLRGLIGSAKGQLAFNKRILVPKTMIVGNKGDGFSRLALVTSLEREEYLKEMVARVLDYSQEDYTGITHRDVPIEDRIGRKSGDCSVLLDMDNLRKFKAVVFSQQLYTELGRKNATLAYCLGGKYYFCADSIGFRQLYFGLVNGIQVSDGFRVR